MNLINSRRTFGLNEYNYSSSPNEADRLALKGDWTVVGDDLWKALDKFGQEGSNSN